MSKTRPSKKGFPRVPGVTMLEPRRFRVAVASRGGSVYLGVHDSEESAMSVSDCGRWVISKYEGTLAARLAKAHIWCRYDAAVTYTEEHCQNMLGSLLYDRCKAVGSNAEAAVARRGAGSRNVLSRVVVVERELATYAQRVADLEKTAELLVNRVDRVHARLFTNNNPQASTHV